MAYYDALVAKWPSVAGATTAQTFTLDDATTTTSIVQAT